MKLFLIEVMLGFIKNMDVLIFFYLDFLRHFSLIEFYIDFFGYNFDKFSFDLITKYRSSIFFGCFEILKYIHKKFVFVELKEFILLIRFWFRVSRSFVNRLSKGVEGTTHENVVEGEMADFFHEFQYFL
jgi:hypothetical protein